MPVIDGARDLIADGMVAGGTRRNHAFVAPDVDWNGLPEHEQLLLADAQTSGGLLVSVAADAAGALVDALARHDTLANAVIGRVTDAPIGRLRVLTG